MNAPLEAKIQSRIDAFVHDLSGLVRQAAIESVQEALGAGAPTRRATTRPRRSGTAARRTSGKRIRRSLEQLEAMSDDILAHVRANPGQRADEIGAAVGVSTKDLRRPVTMLLEAEKLRSEGQKRGTRYFAGAGRKKKATRTARRR